MTRWQLVPWCKRAAVSRVVISIIIIATIYNPATQLDLFAFALIISLFCVQYASRVGLRKANKIAGSCQKKSACLDNDNANWWRL